LQLLQPKVLPAEHEHQFLPECEKLHVVLPRMQWWHLRHLRLLRKDQLGRRVLRVGTRLPIDLRGDFLVAIWVLLATGGGLLQLFSP